MRTGRRATEVEEQAEHIGILALLQDNTLLGQHKRLVGRNVMLLYEEIVVIATVGKFHGHCGTVLVGLHHQLEMVALGSTGGELGIDMELTLPLRTTQSFGKGNLIDIALVGCLVVGNGAPASVSEIVAKGIEPRTIVNSFPQVVGIIVVHGNSLFKENLADLDMCTGRRATEVEEQADDIGILALLQGNTLVFQDEGLVGCNIITIHEEVVVVTTVGKFHGDTRTVLVGLHH